MLVKRFREYLDKVFKSLPDSKDVSDFKAELLDNLTSRAIDMQNEGLSEDEIYDNCIASLGDYSDTLRTFSKIPATVVGMVRDARFWRNIMYAIAFALVVSIIYIVIGFFTNAWGLAAVIIFPTLAGLIYIFATMFFLNRNIGIKRHWTTGIILSSYAVIFVLVLFFVLTWGANLPVSRTWAIFPTIPAVCGMMSIITFKFFRKKRVPLVVILAEVILIALAAYLIIASVLWAFHPYWLIMLVAIAVDVVILTIKINQRISKKNSKQ